MGNVATGLRRKVEERDFRDPWFKQYEEITGGVTCEDGHTVRFPMRISSHGELQIYGTVDAKKMWADFPHELYEPVLVGGKAVVSVWCNELHETDSGPGPYRETWYNTFVTEKGKPPISVPYETPMSLLVNDPNCLQFFCRDLCGDVPLHPGAALGGIMFFRQVYGYPKHPAPADFKFHYNNIVDGTKRVEVDVKCEGKQAIKASVEHPEASQEGLVTIPVDVVTPPGAAVGGPRLFVHQTRYHNAINCTLHAKPWDPTKDSIEFGDDPFFAGPIKGWDFEPLLKVHTYDFKIVFFQPDNWLSAEETAKKLAH